jgi:hypothetical protein
MTNQIDALKLALEAHQAMREWIDAVPDDTVLPAMPGCDRDWLDTVEANLKQALAAQPAPVQEPEIVQRVKRYAGQTMRTARNPNITARECIELANWLAANTTPPAPKKDQP